jgi:hypothetical protein
LEQEALEQEWVQEVLGLELVLVAQEQVVLVLRLELVEEE